LERDHHYHDCDVHYIHCFGTLSVRRSSLIPNHGTYQGVE
jgi:hypothetical protein